jgi:alkanesulfonate monooxygenase SsuD/methylene tetrahydromethanopterin reductase-like flavin-dependent oxidoreductase (luciferase family)
MRFGLTTDFRNPPGSGKSSATAYAEIIELFIWAETLGFGAAYIFEHHFTDDDYISSPMVAATAIAARTKHMRVGPDIAILPLYDPVRVAEDGAVLDLTSNGRLASGSAIGRRNMPVTAWILVARERAPTRRCRSFARYGRVRPSPSTASTSMSRAPGSRPARSSSRTRQFGLAASAEERRAARYGDGYVGPANRTVYEMYLAELRAAGKDPRGRA